jgi:hypothetical protein
MAPRYWQLAENLRVEEKREMLIWLQRDGFLYRHYAVKRCLDFLY